MRVKRKFVLTLAIKVMLIALCGCRANKIHDDGNYATATTTVTPPALRTVSPNAPPKTPITQNSASPP